MNDLAAAVQAQPLTDEQLSRVSDAVAGLSAAQLQWVSGYAAGLGASQALPTAGAPGARAALTILYGSQTGNGERIAAELAAQADAMGYASTLRSLADYRAADLKRESLVVLVVSTHGEGDPPDDAEIFHEFLLSGRAPQLSSLRYAVLALGDSSYINFCQTGRELDARLAELGAKRLLPAVECDLDFDVPAASWSRQILDGLPDWLDTTPAAPALRAVPAASRYGRNNPFPATVLANQKITGAGSSKDVRHVELSLEGSGLAYEPGDALAVVASNPPQLVDQLIELLDLDPDCTLDDDGESRTLVDILTNSREITATNLAFLRAWAGQSQSQELAALLREDHRDELAGFVESRQVIDVVRQFPAAVGAGAFVDMLRRLAPRSYSIASSQLVTPDEVHLTVAPVRYRAFGSEHWGAASTHIADRTAVGSTLSVFVEPNKRFRLPDDDATDIIMIGPGTGVAPFRAFVEERMARGATGRNWLIFGDRNFSSDFLYQLEWLRHLRDGRLHRLDVAFSRDQAHKVYVQQRIREHAATIMDWVDGGAIIYVCGDAKRMAGDVDEALTDIIAARAGIARADAEDRLKALRRDGRYRKDVY